MAEITISWRPITIDELLALLKQCDHDKRVVLPLEYYGLDGSAGSYRGYYDQIALGYGRINYGDDDEEKFTVRKLIELLNTIKGQVFEGWKGGQYRMTGDTPVWIANPGNTSGGVIGLVEGWEVCLILSKFD